MNIDVEEERKNAAERLTSVQIESNIENDRKVAVNTKSLDGARRSTSYGNGLSSSRSLPESSVSTPTDRTKPSVQLETVPNESKNTPSGFDTEGGKNQINPAPSQDSGLTHSINGALHKNGLPNNSLKPKEENLHNSGAKQLAKQKAIEQGIQALSKAHPVIAAIAKTRAGKKISKAIASGVAKKKKFSFFPSWKDHLPQSESEKKEKNEKETEKQTATGQFKITVKRAAKIVVILIPCIIVTCLLGCIILPLVKGDNGLGSLLVANEIKDPEEAGNKLNDSLEDLTSDDDTDSYFGESEDSVSQDSSSKSNKSDDTSTTTRKSTAILTTPPKKDNDINNSSNKSGVGSFKKNIFYYNQYDYGGYSYSYYGTIASHGCGPTSLAIAISSLLQEEHDPIELTEYVCSIGGCTSDGSAYLVIYQAAKDYGEKYGFTAEPTSDTDLVKKKLSEGNSIVVTITNGGFYTNSGNLISNGGHYFTLTGVDEDGQVFLSDPANSNNTGRTIDIEALAINSNNRPDAPSFCILTK